MSGTKLGCEKWRQIVKFACENFIYIYIYIYMNSDKKKKQNFVGCNNATYEIFAGCEISVLYLLLQKLSKNLQK